MSQPVKADAGLSPTRMPLEIPRREGRSKVDDDPTTTEAWRPVERSVPAGNQFERLLETFFRRPWLYSLPFVVCVAFGVVTAVSAPQLYVSVGIVDVSDDTLLSNLSEIGGGGFSYETPASRTSDEINERLFSDAFVRSIADAAGLTTALESGVIDLDYVRSRVGAADDGDNLLRVQAGSHDPVVAARMAQATIDTFIQSIVDKDLSESQTAVTFYNDVANSYLDDIDRARDDLEGYLRSHPEPSSGDRPAAEVAALSQLTAALERSEGRFGNALDNAEQARLAMEQARVDVQQRIQLIDPPTVPSAPVSGLRAAAMTIVMFGVLGSLLSAGFVLLASFLDQSMWTRGDVRRRLGVEVLAVVPAARLPRLERRG
jgi:uncharacterized protein involved in exopolysaccharide biosynthesis